MKVTVLKPFRYSADGIHGLDAAVGSVADIPDPLIPGLVKEGFAAVPRHRSSPSEGLFGAAPAAIVVAAEDGAAPDRVSEDSPPAVAEDGTGQDEAADTAASPQRKNRRR